MRRRALLALAFALPLVSPAAPASRGLTPDPGAGLCRALPVAAIEAALGQKAGTMGGRDLEDYQSCTANFGDAAVKVEHHTAGQPGLPVDVPSGLAGLLAAFGPSLREVETRDFGDIGCYRGVLELMGHSMHSTACFQPAGYYTIGVSSPRAAIPMEKVKELLEKTIAQRR